MATDNGIGSVSLTVAYTQLTVDTTNGTQSFNLGAALPAGAIPVAAQVQISTPFAGLAAPTIAIGVSGGTSIASAFDTTQSAGKYVLAHPGAAQYDAAQLTVVFTPQSSEKLHTNTSAGALTVTVWFFDPS